MRTYVRLESTNRMADAALMAELGRRTGVETFDEQPIVELASEAIDFGAASQCFADQRRLRRKDLTALDAADDLRVYRGRIAGAGAR